MNVGILNSRYFIGRYNTDRTVLKDMLKINRMTAGVRLAYATSRTASFDLALRNSILGRRINRAPHVFAPVAANWDLFYHYASPLNVDFSKTVQRLDRPLCVTSGFGLSPVERAKGQSFLDELAVRLAMQLKGVSCVHFHTDFSRHLWLSHLARCGVTAPTSVTVPFVLPYLEAASEAAIAAKFSAANPSILFVGYDGIRKGIQDLCSALEAIAAVPAMADVAVTIVSATKPTCEKFKRITWHPKLTRMEVLAAMDSHQIFILPTRFDTYGIAFLEAMAKGCAVIADGDPIRDEIVDCPESTPRVNSGDVPALGRAILDLVEDSARRYRLALALRKKFITSFHWQKVAPAYARMFAATAAK